MLDRDVGGGPAGDTDSSVDALFKNSELDEGLKGTHMKTEQKRFHHEVDSPCMSRDPGFGEGPAKVTRKGIPTKRKKVWVGRLFWRLRK